MTDAGSGVATVRANVSTVTTGQTAVALVAGSYSVGGVSYNYRSASVTANAVLAEGAKAYTITATDVAAKPGDPGRVASRSQHPTDSRTSNHECGHRRPPALGDTSPYLLLSYRPRPAAGWRVCGPTSCCVTQSAAATRLRSQWANTAVLPLARQLVGRTTDRHPRSEPPASVTVLQTARHHRTLGTLPARSVAGHCQPHDRTPRRRPPTGRQHFRRETPSRSSAHRLLGGAPTSSWRSRSRSHPPRRASAPHRWPPCSRPPPRSLPGDSGGRGRPRRRRRPRFQTRSHPRSRDTRPGRS